jgi:hypothetical protein
MFICRQLVLRSVEVYVESDRFSNSFAYLLKTGLLSKVSDLALNILKWSTCSPDRVKLGTKPHLRHTATTTTTSSRSSSGKQPLANHERDHGCLKRKRVRQHKDTTDTG